QGGSGQAERPESQGDKEEEKEGPGAGEEKKDAASQGGLEFYQAPQKDQDPGEMSEREAKMLLEGYKGEEATGRAVKLRTKHIDVSEPSRDW
ncbi:MAG TPA: hypothetical protein PLV52_02905, partial [Candidatus Omnitrophota bacterium]|nr:hypothetical protein [Candidatus Omnitrophota bacterium]